MNTLSNIELAATRVGMVDCAHHNMKLPSSVGDHQKGERLLSTFAHYNTLTWTMCSFQHSGTIQPRFSIYLTMMHVSDTSTFGFIY